MYYWVKGEINDVIALQQAITTRLLTNISSLTKIKNKINGFVLEREKISTGKKSLKTIFKSSKETETYSVTLQKGIDSQE